MYPLYESRLSFLHVPKCLASSVSWSGCVMLPKCLFRIAHEYMHIYIYIYSVYIHINKPMSMLSDVYDLAPTWQYLAL